MEEAYKEVFVGNAMAVLLLKGIFGDHGIPFIEKNEQLSGVLAGFSGGTGTSIKVFVIEEFQEDALALIADFRDQLQNS
ncbi:MAG: hypothetical protein ACI9KR_000904 [Arcticibacterium sp.]|jgi:hypothetical protein|tara:strand:+ start:482 stop:718 length:237 start_codon:yes stop_codon:yes gene_type:complete